MDISYIAIENDYQAEDLITKIAEAKAETDRLIDICKHVIADYEAKIGDYNLMHENNIRLAMSMLGEYCKNKANHVTKTLVSYKLPSGKLQWKKRDPKYVVNDGILLAWARAYMPDKIRMKESADWSEIKKLVQKVDDTLAVTNSDGELIELEGVTTEEQEDVFEIK